MRVFILLASALCLLGTACSSSSSSGFVPSSGATGGHEPTEAKSQAALNRLIAAGVPGGALMVSSPDQQYSIAAGTADPEFAFPLGGVATTYVAAVLIQMADEGLIDLGESVEDHLPGLLEYGWDVAVYDLLQHIAGVPDFYTTGAPPGVVITECAAAGRCEWTATEAIDLISDLESDFQPGEGWGWSNSNYRVAELVIEELTGATWEQVVRQRLLEPLGLDATLVPADWGSVNEHVARGHSDIDGDGDLEDVTQLLPYGSGAAGAMISTLDDLIAFMEPLLTGTLLSQAADVALFAAAPTGFGAEEYGHGVIFPAGEGAHLIATAGEALGYSIYVEHDMDTATTTAIALTQSGGIDPDLWGDLVIASTHREECAATDRGTEVPGGLRLYCAVPATPPGPS